MWALRRRWTGAFTCRADAGSSWRACGAGGAGCGTESESTGHEKISRRKGLGLPGPVGPTCPDGPGSPGGPAGPLGPAGPAGPALRWSLLSLDLRLSISEVLSVTCRPNEKLNGVRPSWLVREPLPFCPFLKSAHGLNSARLQAFRWSLRSKTDHT